MSEELSRITRCGHCGGDKCCLLQGVEIDLVTGDVTVLSAAEDGSPGCDRCGKSGEGMNMGQAIEAGWWFTPPTSAPDAPDAYCPDCAAFLKNAVCYDYSPAQRCRACNRQTTYAALKAGVCIECIFADAQGQRRRGNRLETAALHLTERVRQMLPGVKFGRCPSLELARQIQAACEAIESEVE